MTAHALRHPILRQHNCITCNANLILLIFGCSASINWILLSSPIHDVIGGIWHFIFSISCFASFIIYQAGYNCLIAVDLWRNRLETWKNNSNACVSIGQRYYTMLGGMAFFIGITCNILTVSGFLLWIFGVGIQYQWLAIISVIMFYFPEYLLSVIRDGFLLRKN